MRFRELLEIVGAEPLFDTGLLLAGDVDPADVRRQLARWVDSGRVLKLRRGLYTLAQPYSHMRPHPFLVVNRLVRGFYVSLHSLLDSAGMIPEAVPVVTSVTTGRPGRRETPLGPFDYRHVKPGLFWGYRGEELGGGHTAFLALPEKALLDLVHLQPGGDSPEFLDELRLQNLEGLDLDRLRQFADRFGRPRVARAAAHLEELVRSSSLEYESL